MSDLQCKGLIRTCSFVAGELLVDLPHPLQVEAADLGMVDDGLGVVHSYDAFGLLLGFHRRVPRIVDILGWEVLQYWQITSGSRSGKKEGGRFRNGWNAYGNRLSAPISSTANRTKTRSAIISFP